MVSQVTALIGQVGSSLSLWKQMTRRVLVVEDDEQIRDAVCEYLMAHGYVTDGIGGAGEAEALLANISYDLLIVDLAPTCTGGRGLDLLRFAAALEHSPRAIVLTAQGNSPYQQEARKYGAAAILSKPVRLDALLAVVEKMVPLPRRKPGNRP
jgi:two-component system OmpR family response regulator